MTLMLPPRAVRRVRRAAALVGLLVTSISTASAQPTPVEGSVTVVGTAEAVAGALVYLIDEDFLGVAAVLTDSVGAFRLTAPRPGPYSLRIERIGYETAQFPTFVLPPGGVRSLRPLVQVRPVELEGLSVTAERVCDLRGDGGALMRVWSEARKALTATVLSEARGEGEFLVEVSERRVNRRLLVLGERVDTVRTSWNRAFDFVPVEELAEVGWGRVQDGAVWEVYGPSPQVLLSPWFAEHHCLAVSSSTTDSIVGLDFSSREGDFQVGIVGTFWFERDSWELRRITFQFTGLLNGAAATQEGGEIELRTDDEGSWYVEQWRIRMPTERTRGGGLFGGGGRDFLLSGYVETAGRVLERLGSPRP